MQIKSLTVVAIVLSLFWGITGCSTISDVFTKPSPAFLSADEGSKQIENSVSLTDIFNTNKIVNVTKADSKDYLICEGEADSFVFPTGKSFYRIFQLPLNAAYLGIEFDSAISTTTFIPRVDFYNKDKKLVSTLKSSAFKYRDSQLGTGFIVGKIAINNVAAKPGHEFAYMVVYTTDEVVAEKTATINPLIKQAIALRNDVPDAPDVLVSHSYIGEVNIEFKFRQKEDNFTDDLISYLDDPLFGGSDQSNRQEKVVLASGEVYSVSSQNEGSTAVTSVDGNGNALNVSNSSDSSFVETNQGNTVSSQAPVGQMMKETEDLYNKLIVNSVEAGDLTKAMNLVAEAQRAGSQSAQQKFIEAVQKVKIKK
jgi:maltose operon periplasmic protein